MVQVSFKNDIFSCETSTYNIHHSKQYFLGILFIFKPFLLYPRLVLNFWFLTSTTQVLGVECITTPSLLCGEDQFKAEFMLGKSSTNE